MALNSVRLLSNYENFLEEDAGFVFSAMPDHKKYELNPDGTAKLDDNNNVIIIKDYGVPSMSLILSSVSKETIDEFTNYYTVEEISNVNITDLNSDDFLYYDGTNWINGDISGNNSFRSSVREIVNEETSGISTTTITTTTSNVKNIGMVSFESTKEVVVLDGRIAFSVPSTLNNFNLNELIVTVNSLGSGSGTTDVMVRRRRSGSEKTR